MIVTAKPYREMSLAELRAEYLRWSELLGHTTVASARESVIDCRAICATWIARRERDGEMAA
jgi:hypothetical protein